MRLRRLSRSPLLFWVAVAFLAFLTAAVMGRLVGRARAEAARYGSLRTVAVATRGVEAGTVVRPADVADRRMPAAFLPDGWAGGSSEVVGRTVVVPLFRGQPVVRAQLAPAGLRGVAALLRRGTRAVAVPTGEATPPVSTGDVVDVLASFDPQAAADGDPTVAVAAGAEVVAVGDGSATVAVTPEEARRVAFAVSHGAVTLSVSAGPEPADRGP